MDEKNKEKNKANKQIIVCSSVRLVVFSSKGSCSLTYHFLLWEQVQYIPNNSVLGGGEVDEMSLYIGFMYVRCFQLIKFYSIQCLSV